MKYLIAGLPLLPVLAFSQTFELEKIIVGSKRGIEEDVYTGEVDSINDFVGAGNEKVIDELRQLPGVSISQSGAPGQQATIFIRGSEARHVLVLIDGVRVNDPSNTDKFFNSALLNVGDIEKIEVLKGSQTLLYGSEAMGGVVNIITKKGSSKNSVRVYSGFSRGVEFDNTLFIGDSVLHAYLYHEKSEGVSAARGGDEKDGFENKGVTLNYSRRFSDSFEGEWTYKLLDQFVETDTLDFVTSVPVDAIGDYSKSIQQIFSQKLKKASDNYEFSYLLGANKVDRSNKSFGTVNGFEAIEYTNELHWTRKEENGSWLIGVENLSEKFEQSGVDEKFAGLTSLLFIRDARQADWFWQYGARASYHTQFEGVFAPSAGVGRFFDKHRFAFNYQRGFKSPTLYQLYGPDFGAFKVGNKDLAPETNDYFDLNYRYQRLVDLSVFYSRVDDFIEYDASAGYINSIFLETYGAEASSEFAVGNNVLRPGIFLAHYHIPNDREALRKPSQKATFSYERKVNDMQRLVLDWVWSGKTFDSVGGELVELSPYDVLNLHYEIRQGDATFNGGFENLLGKSYQQVYGYNSQPFTVYLKMKFNY